MASQNAFGPISYSAAEMSSGEHCSAVLRALAARRDDRLKWKAATMLRQMARAVRSDYAVEKADDTYAAWREATLLAVTNGEPYKGEQPTDRFPDASAQAAAYAGFGELLESGWFPPVETPTFASAAIVNSEVRSKRYEDMKPLERIDLKKREPELFAKLRSDWQRRGMPGPAAAAG